MTSDKKLMLKQALMVTGMVGLALGTAWVVRSTPQIGILAGRAWSGAQVNLANVRQAAGVGPRQPGRLASLATQSPSTGSGRARETARLFHELTRIYWDAEVQNISAAETLTQVVSPDQRVSEANKVVQGVAFLAYDPELDSSFVFSRVEGLPTPYGSVLQLWLTRDAVTYTPVGVAGFVEEGGAPVAYSVFTAEGDLRGDSTLNLLFSYDISLGVESPELIVISLYF
ncbi:MAG: hypothetical protein HYS86_04095 [Candidatus Chisholmbacteria bacterium]|nr:hypothetical protein [Candidatus Chisholmbacteria bacterium]